ncbi:hypothetical protein Tco_0576049, partial [Tanacetum coccineum]
NPQMYRQAGQKSHKWPNKNVDDTDKQYPTGLTFTSASSIRAIEQSNMGNHHHPIGREGSSGSVGDNKSGGNNGNGGFSKAIV